MPFSIAVTGDAIICRHCGNGPDQTFYVTLEDLAKLGLIRPEQPVTGDAQEIARLRERLEEMTVRANMLADVAQMRHDELDKVLAENARFRRKFGAR